LPAGAILEMSALSPKLTPGFSLVIPAWNEEARLERTLERYVPAFETAGKDYEIIVVTDGCTDATKSVAEKMGARGVHVLEFSHRLGKGAAVLEGLRVARYDRLGFADADGSVSAQDVLRVVAALDGSDCAIASRRAPGSSYRTPRRLIRATLSRGWNLLVRGLLFLPFGDTQCGVKFLRRSAYLHVQSRTKAFRDWAFDVGLLALLHQDHRSITEVAVAWSEEEGSKFNVVRDAPRMFRSLVGIRLMRPDRREMMVAPWGLSLDQPAPTPFTRASPQFSSTLSSVVLSAGASGRTLSPSFAPDSRWNDRGND